MIVYKQIKDKLLKLIETSNIHEMIPSERELSLEFDVSRMTVRKAIDELVNDGYLYRKKNQGTYIADRSIIATDDLSDDLTFYECDHHLIYFNLKANDSDIAKKLHLKDEFEIIRAIKVNKKNNKPISIEEICISKSNFEKIHNNDIEKLLNLTMYNEKKKKIKIHPRVVPVKYANLLETKMGELILQVDIIVFEDSGEPILYVKRFNTAGNDVELVV